MNKVSKLLLISLFAIGLTAGCGNNKKEEKNTESTMVPNETIIESSEVFTFEKKSLEYKNDKTIIETTVTNTSSDKEYLKDFIIRIYNAKGSEMAMLKTEFKDYIDANSSKVVTSEIDIDLTKASKVKYEIIG